MNKDVYIISSNKFNQLYSPKRILIASLKTGKRTTVWLN